MTNTAPPDPGPVPPPPGGPSWYAGAPGAPGAPDGTSGPRSGPGPARRSDASGRPGMAAGIVLVVIGAAVLAERLLERQLGAPAWPVWMVVPGIAMLVGSLFIPSRGGLGLAVPGAILAIVGGILWFQEVTGLYTTWAYAWALVAPTGPGLAMLVHGASHRDRELAADGLRATGTGIALFVGFGFFFEGVLGLNGHPIARVEEILPYGLIALGAMFVLLSMLGGKRPAGR